MGVIKPEHGGKTITITDAPAPVDKQLFVDATGAAGTSGDDVAGINMLDITTTGNDMTVQINGTAHVIAGAALTENDQLQCGTGGKAAPVIGTGRRVAVALETGALNGVVLVKII